MYLLFLTDTIDLDSNTYLQFKNLLQAKYFWHLIYRSYNNLLEGPAVQLIRRIDLLELIDEISTSYYCSQDDLLLISPIYVDSYTNINTSLPNSIIDRIDFLIKEFVNQIRS